MIDIGKTNAKVLAVDLDTGAETVVARRPNRVLPGPPYPHHDIAGLWDFVLEGLRLLAGQGGVDAVSITTHGAAAVQVDAAGQAVLPMLDAKIVALVTLAILGLITVFSADIASACPSTTALVTAS